jgi:hypothetical protein
MLDSYFANFDAKSKKISRYKDDNQFIKIVVLFCACSNTVQLWNKPNLLNGILTSLYIFVSFENSCRNEV